MLLSAATAALAAALLISSPGSRRLRGLMAQRGPQPGRRRTQRRWWASPVVAAILGAFAVLQVIPPPIGLLPAIGAGVAAHRWVAKAESTAQRRRRERLTQDLPLAVDLLVACLSVGRPPLAALSTVAGALRGPMAQELRAAAAQLELGADATLVWQRMASDPVLGPLGRSMARASRSGSSVTSALSRCADDARRARRTHAQARARSVGVKAAGPLGACFLPAFVLVGIVPTIVSLFGDVVP